MGLRFKVSELRQELNSFQVLARELLGPGSESVLQAAASELDGIARSDSGEIRWEIYPDNPLRSNPSIGEYMPDDEGGEVIYAEFTFVWQLRPIRPSGNTQPAKLVELSGLASTAIRLIEGDPWEAGEHRELAMWKMEVASDDSPGAYFHVQVLGRDDDLLFPKSVDVPRLPGVLNSPFACMEFVLGELFQAQWARIAQKESAELRNWTSIQARRHKRHLTWVAEQISSTSGSPWLAWKLAKPEPELYLES